MNPVKAFQLFVCLKEIWQSENFLICAYLPFYCCYTVSVRLKWFRHLGCGSLIWQQWSRNLYILQQVLNRNVTFVFWGTISFCICKYPQIIIVTLVFWETISFCICKYPQIIIKLVVNILKFSFTGSFITFQNNIHVINNKNLVFTTKDVIGLQLWNKYY